MKKFVAALAVVSFIPIASACSATLKARTPPERPALDVPPPPPRVIEPSPVPDEPPEPVPDLPAAPAPAKTTRSQPPRTTPASQEPKPEVKAETPPTTETPAPQPAPAQSATQVPQLRTPQTADAAEAEKNVRSTLERAKSMLSNVNYSPLSTERKKAYNDAKTFIQQAEDYLKQRNYALAQGVANKAETLAHELAGR